MSLTSHQVILEALQSSRMVVEMRQMCLQRSMPPRHGPCCLSTASVKWRCAHPFYHDLTVTCSPKKFDAFMRVFASMHRLCNNRRYISPVHISCPPSSIQTSGYNLAVRKAGSFQLRFCCCNFQLVAL